MQWVLGAVSPEVKLKEREGDRLHQGLRSRMVEINLHSSIHIHGMLLVS
jgi:hypothetical protein